MGAIKVMEVAAGKTVKVAGSKWVVLDHIEGKGTLCLMEGILEQRAFHEEDDNYCNNWENSSLRKYLNSEFATKLLDRPLAEMEVDLTSDDGMTDYGKTKDYIALLTADQYRKYRALIPNADDWWWTATPWSCNSAYSYDVRGVYAGGTLSSGYACCGGYGVRPALIFKESVIADDDNPAERSEAEIKMHDAFKEAEQKATKALAELSEMKDCIEESMETIEDLLSGIEYIATMNKK